MESSKSSGDRIAILYPESPTAPLRRQWLRCRRTWQALKLVSYFLREAEATAHGKACAHCQLGCATNCEAAGK